MNLGSKMSDYTVINELGRGSYGVVFKVSSNAEPGSIYVLKKITLTHLK